MSNPRGSADLVGHTIYPAPILPAQTDNVIIQPKDPALRWVGELTERIGPWRARMRSTYIRWALSINGLEVASKRYDEPTWQKTHKEFVISSLRPRAGEDNGEPELEPTIIAGWDGPKAADAHRQTMPMLAAFGLIDLYATLEEFVFDIYKVFLNHNRDDLLGGKEFQHLKRLKRDAEVDPSKREEWEKAWLERLESWQRRRLYNGLGKVFRGFCNTAGIKHPSCFKSTTVETWSVNIETIALVRNCLTHGVSTVPKELADACKTPFRMSFDFEEGQPLSITLVHLQGVELFCHQLLTAINMSLVERAYGPAKDWKTNLPDGR